MCSILSFEQVNVFYLFLLCSSLANIITTPYGKRQEEKEVSPTNSENSASSGHSSRSSNQTSSTLFSEDSLYNNKNVYNGHYNQVRFFYLF